METVVRNIQDLDADQRSALERVIGHTLAEGQQVVIQVTDNAQRKPVGAITRAGQLPDWCHVYEGLTEEQIDELDRAIVRMPGGRDVM